MLSAGGVRLCYPNMVTGGYCGGVSLQAHWSHLGEMECYNWVIVFIIFCRVDIEGEGAAMTAW